MADDKLNELEGRLERIERALGSRMRREPGEPVELTDEELKAYIKVRDVMTADLGELYGVHCILCKLCYPCHVCLPCRPCDVECTCGPCIIGGIRGGVGDFRRFGG